MGKSKKKNEKSLSIGKKLLLILLFSCSLVATAVFAAFAVDNIISLVFAVPAGIIAFISFLILLKDYKPEKKTKNAKEKTTRWYVDKFLVALVPLWVVAAIVLIINGYEDDEMIMYAGFLMFPVISIIIAPNAALYAVKDAKGWQGIFYGKGTLQKYKDNKDFYWVKTPVDFEKRIFRAVVRNQILNIFTAVVVLFIVAVAGLTAIITYNSHSVSPGDVLGAVRYVSLRRGTGYMAFMMLLAVVFGFPIFVYYVTSTIYKLRIVSGHKYMAYHAIVKSMNGYQMRINCDGRHYEYKYSTLVGMRSGQIQDTPAVLIFIPDDVLIFPDEIFSHKS